ncbi:predicted protein [Nematostella vectensis]|uniref:Endonuclease/exonuclease/phosphatase domain-containing protein n=1 Tax=Nematostella vectensis TaxID=45351 RepID=A7T4C3_NEMVE|nr:predicted protein [Nematostella vectensis]|eukprot:XP_001621289.1 hypothetical protein NEMVEDRAFT_v1g222147 [Nematostella vectensis]
MTKRHLYASSRFILLVLLLSSLKWFDKPNTSLLNQSSWFSAFNLGCKVFPSRNCGLQRSSSGPRMPPCLKLRASIYMTKVGICAFSLIILSGDISLNPGPFGNSMNVSSSSAFSTTYTDDSDVLSESSIADSDFYVDSSTSDVSDSVISDYFNINLGENGIRFGSWNVDCLTMPKFEQLKLLMLDKDSRPQVDVLSINESALKPSIPDSLYSIPHFDMYRRDRKGSKKKGGVLMYVNTDLKHKRRTDLEDTNIESIWMEIYPFKSNRPVLFNGLYRPPSYCKEDDIALENNVESAYLLNFETIILGDLNINYLASSNFKKHRLVRAFTSMNFKQLVTQVTRPISETCLDHIFSNRPERIHSIGTRDFALSDHLPVFAVRLYSKTKNPRAIPGKIMYRRMKDLDKSRFLSTLKTIPWDTAFLFDTIDDILGAWEQLFNGVLDNHCPWREKRVARMKIDTK